MYKWNLSVDLARLLFLKLASTSYCSETTLHITPTESIGILAHSFRCFLATCIIIILHLLVQIPHLIDLPLKGKSTIR